MIRRWVAAFAIAGMAALAAACGPDPASPTSGAAPTNGPSRTTGASSAPVVSPSPGAVSASPTASPEFVYTGLIVGALDERVNADGTSASGCTPGGGALPDGVWGGLIAEWGNPTSLSFDLECVYGSSSQKVADYTAACLVRTGGAVEMCQTSVLAENSSTALRSEPLAPGATLIYQEGTGTWREVPIAQAPLDATTNATGGPAEHVWWIYVNDGRITQVLYDMFPG